MTEQLKIVISAEINKFKQNIENAKKKTKDFATKGIKDVGKFKDSLRQVGDTCKAFTKVALTSFAAAGAALLALSETTREYRNEQAMLTTAFETAGGSAETAKQTYNDLYRVLGDTGQAAEAAQHLAQLTTNQTDLSEWTGICQGVYATFGESLPIESLAEAANETAKSGELTGALTDALVWAGISEDDFKASLLECNNEAERETLIRETLNGLYSDAATTFEKNNAQVLAQNEAQSKLNDAMATMGEVTAPIMTMLKEFAAETLAKMVPTLQELATKYLPDIEKVLSKVGDVLSVVIGWLIEHWEIVAAVAGVIAAISTAITILSVALSVYNTVMAITQIVTAPITLIILAVVAAIAAIIAIVILVIKYWDDLVAFTKKCWDACVNAVKAAVDWIVQFFQKIISWIKDNWQALLLLLVNPFAGAFKLLYDNCDGFRNFINNFIAKIKEGIQTGFAWIKDKIVSPIKDAFNAVKETFNKLPEIMRSALDKAQTAVKTIIDKIKGFFKFEWSLPKLKVPKFSISPSGWGVGDLLKGVIPKLSIAWNARGGVFDKPTLFNYGDSLQGIGERGAEAVVPLENNLEWLDKLANMLGERMGSTPVVLQVDGKTFATTSINTINKLTRQTGKLGLTIV